jgi:hypothetical protein
MKLSVKKVKALDDYKLNIVFNNNESKILDMKPYLDFGVFNKIRNVDIFKSVFVSFDTIEWENGVDLDPDFIYQKSIKVS